MLFEFVPQSGEYQTVRLNVTTMTIMVPLNAANFFLKYYDAVKFFIHDYVYTYKRIWTCVLFQVYFYVYKDVFLNISLI